MVDPVTNFAFGDLDSTGMTSVATSFNFVAGHGARFPATSLGAYNVVVYDKGYGNAALAYQEGKAEIIRINTLATDAVSSCTRAQEGTTALNFNTIGKLYRVERIFTKLDYNNLELPSQIGNSGKHLTTNGTSPSWTQEKQVVVVSPGNATIVNNTLYVIFGYGNTSLTEYKINLGAGTAQNFRVFNQGNAFITSYQVTLRKNGVDTAITVNCPANPSGILSTDNNTVTTISTDMLSCKVVAGTNGGYAPIQTSISFDWLLS